MFKIELNKLNSRFNVNIYVDEQLHIFEGRKIETNDYVFYLFGPTYKFDKISYEIALKLVDFLIEFGYCDILYKALDKKDNFYSFILRLKPKLLLEIL